MRKQQFKSSPVKAGRRGFVWSSRSSSWGIWWKWKNRIPAAARYGRCSAQARTSGLNARDASIRSCLRGANLKRIWRRWLTRKHDRCKPPFYCGSSGRNFDTAYAELDTCAILSEAKELQNFSWKDLSTLQRLSGAGHSWFQAPGIFRDLWKNTFHRIENVLKLTLHQRYAGVIQW